MKRATFQLGDMLSWQDVGLAVLHRAGWRPESSRSQTTNIERALPPDANKFRFFAEAALTEQPCHRTIDGRNLQAAKVRVIAGAVTVDTTHAAAVCIMLENTTQVCHGFAHGRGDMSDNSTCVQGVILLYALRVLREWLGAIDQRLVQHITVRAGSGGLCHSIKQWMNAGACGLEPAAVSGIINELQRKEDWSDIDTAPWPLYLPEPIDDQEHLSHPIRTFLSIAEHFRRAMLDRKPGDWCAGLPTLPLTPGEMKQRIDAQFERDEASVLKILAELGSQSAAIIR